jgi:hypothetical protein
MKSCSLSIKIIKKDLASAPWSYKEI